MDAVAQLSAMTQAQTQLEVQVKVANSIRDSQEAMAAQILSLISESAVAAPESLSGHRLNVVA